MFSMKNYSAALSLLGCLGLIISSGCRQPSGSNTTHSCTVNPGVGAGIAVIIVINGNQQPGSQVTDANGNVTVTVSTNTPCSNVLPIQAQS